METLYPTRRTGQRLSRRGLLQAGLAAGVTLDLAAISSLDTVGAEAGPPRRGGILRVRGWDPPHFDPHLTIAPAHFTLSLIYSRLVRHKTGPDVQPGTFMGRPGRTLGRAGRHDLRLPPAPRGQMAQ